MTTPDSRPPGSLALRAAVAIAAVAALTWAGDAVVWRLRHRPAGQVEVMRMVVAPLKGGKEEYYPDGSETHACPQSLLPQVIPDADGVSGSQAPCWWVERHTVVFER